MCDSSEDEGCVRSNRTSLYTFWDSYWYDPTGKFFGCGIISCSRFLVIIFLSRLSMRIHNMKITSEMDNKFFWFEKKINVHLIDCLCFYKSGYVIVCCICSALSCRLSAQFCPQLPHGCFACCWLNVSFIHIPLRSFVL